MAGLSCAAQESRDESREEFREEATMKRTQRGLFGAICIFTLGCILLHAGSLFAQNTGTILGTVKDQSGAVLPAAKVTVTNVDTGTSRTSVTGSGGEYRVPALMVGEYE